MAIQGSWIATLLSLRGAQRRGNRNDLPSVIARPLGRGNLTRHFNDCHGPAGLAMTGTGPRNGTSVAILAMTGKGRHSDTFCTGTTSVNHNQPNAPARVVIHKRSPG